MDPCHELYETLTWGRDPFMAQDLDQPSTGREVPQPWRRVAFMNDREGGALRLDLASGARGPPETKSHLIFKVATSSSKGKPWH